MHKLGPIHTIFPTERELRADLQKLADNGGMEYQSHKDLLTSSKQFKAIIKKSPPDRWTPFINIFDVIPGF